ncbi:hypothetical protein KJ765_01410 [Candidatus Micrarchaeota archaeon]|nr:hypothetical protein [Candidatus Micrarchaeota archaeon]
MPSLNIAVLGKNEQEREQAASALAKKGTADDLGFYHTVFQGKIVSVVDPKAYPGKLSSFMQTLSITNQALVIAPEPSPELGEIIVALDALKKHAVTIVTDMDLSGFLNGTSLERAQLVTNIEEAKTHLFSQETPLREGDAEVLIDHCFEVKGVGTVALGFVKQGTINVHDKLQAEPIGKTMEIRSIQKNDADAKTAASGDRVGLSLKGLRSEEVPRGTIFSKTAWNKGVELECEVTATRFRKEPLKSGVIHASLGVQFQPVRIECEEIAPGTSGKAILQFEKPFAFNKGEPLILCDLNAKGLRIVGKTII